MGREKKQAIKASEEQAKAALSRRDALKKLGGYAAYTAPAMMTLMVSTKSTAASRCDPNQQECED